MKKLYPLLLAALFSAFAQVPGQAQAVFDPWNSGGTGDVGASHDSNRSGEGGGGNSIDGRAVGVGHNAYGGLQTQYGIEQQTKSIQAGGLTLRGGTSGKQGMVDNMQARGTTGMNILQPNYAFGAAGPSSTPGTQMLPVWTPSMGSNPAYIDQSPIPSGAFKYGFPSNPVPSPAGANWGMRTSATGMLAPASTSSVDINTVDCPFIRSNGGNGDIEGSGYSPSTGGASFAGQFNPFGPGGSRGPMSTGGAPTFGGISNFINGITGGFGFGN